jgi:hypothetical protein
MRWHPRGWPAFVLAALALGTVTQEINAQCKGGMGQQSGTAMSRNGMQQQMQLMLMLSQMNNSQSALQQQQSAMTNLQQQVALMSALRRQSQYNAFLLAQQNKLAGTVARLQSGNANLILQQQLVTALQMAYQQTQALLNALSTTGATGQSTLVTTLQTQLAALANLIQQYSSSASSS